MDVLAECHEITAERVRSLSVCVFGGARAGNGPGATAVARSVGRMLAARGHSLIYGAGGSGIMGAVAWAADAVGAPITGVIPGFLAERERAQSAPGQQLVTVDLFDRKREMIERADAFLALPGGLGTVDEIAAVLSMRALGLHTKPCVLLDADDLYAPLLALLEELTRCLFMDRLPADALSVARTPREAVLQLELTRI